MNIFYWKVALDCETQPNLLHLLSCSSLLLLNRPTRPRLRAVCWCGPRSWYVVLPCALVYLWALLTLSVDFDVHYKKTWLNWPYESPLMLVWYQLLTGNPRKTSTRWNFQPKLSIKSKCMDWSTSCLTVCRISGLFCESKGFLCVWQSHVCSSHVGRCACTHAYSFTNGL